MKNLLHLFVLPIFIFYNLLHVNELNRSRERTPFHENSQIVYLFFAIEKTDQGMDKIILQDKKMMPGKLKSQPIFNRDSGKAGDLIVSLMDSEGKDVVKQLIEDPLNPEMETYESGISRHKVSLQNAEFSVRYSHSAEISSVKVEKITPKSNQLLFTQKL